MSSKIQSIPLDKLTPHPDNPNKMSKANFAKLVRNIERTDRYEPLIVRPIQQKDISHEATKSQRNQLYKKEKTSCLGAFVAKKDCFQIINGHHRWLALKQLGKKEADAIVWDIDDDQADILLATLNRLCGQDVLDKKLALLKRLSEKMQTSELAKLLPQTKAQIEKLNQLAIDKFQSKIGNRNRKILLNPLVFFVSDEQQQVVEAALDSVIEHLHKTPNGGDKTKAARRAAALAVICQYYFDKWMKDEAGKKGSSTFR